MKILLLLTCWLLVDLVASGQTNSIDEIIDRLKSETRNNQRSKLILELAGMPTANDTNKKYDSIVRMLKEWYATNPDPGVHSAIDYFFRHDPKRSLSLAEIGKLDKSLIGQPLANSNWFLTTEGHTMAIIKGPVSFYMGSPLTEKLRDTDEVRHHRSIPRSFAASTKEITVEQFQKFLDQHPGIKQQAKADPSKDPSRDNPKLHVFSPDDDCPQILVTWYEAAQYCNWLSKQEGIPENEWVYPTIGNIKSGMLMPKDNLERTGYRLVTEAEWEYACRAGSTSSRFYGESEELLSQYALYSKNPKTRKDMPDDPNDPAHTLPVGSLKPNAFGLFDVYGNVWEWCHSRRLPYARDSAIDREYEAFTITDSVPMVRRGGSFSYGKDVMRSAHRGVSGYLPMQRRDNVGFRIAKTIW